MEPHESFVATPINPNNFPAKLWRLVNSPLYQSICWDSAGDGVIIDQQLFESELLCPSRGMAEATDLFKTTNFTSFIRQLNLYGFRKLCLGSGSSTGLHHPGGDLGAGDGNVHHFYNDHFQKGRPDLLVNLKRLTSTNKAKLAAGLEVTSRPPNRYQRMLSSSLTEDSREDSQGVEQSHRTCRREKIPPYVNPPSHNHLAFTGKEFDCTPIPPRTWSHSFGLHQRQIASHSSFPENGMFYPVLQHFPSDITYTMQSSATSVHVQQGLPSMPGSVQRFSGYMPHPAQYPQAYYPAAILPCCTASAHMHHLNGCPGPAVSSYQHCSYFQNRPMHPSFPMEFFHTSWPSSESSEFRKDEMTLENVFQFADELQSSSQLEIVKLDTVQSLVGPAASPLQNENVAMAVRPGNDEAYCSQTDHLEPLLHVNADITTEALLVDQPHNCTSPLTSAYVSPLSSDHTEVDMNTSLDADKTLCVDEVDLLASDVLFSPSQIATCEYMHSTNGKAKLEK
ncbi:heat shock factor protein 5 [Bufo gargarizans]|uniref:heat shock factor protein 5 n=1 Tax=Bufo gargarizans TaxID=30331 RepID=UPI001CF16F0C|nr:heat shock factor protein 5 [Bufo gargarizans]